MERADSVNYNALGERLVQARRLKRMSTEVLAEEVGITPAFVRMIERGARRPSIETIVGMCNVLGTNPNAMLIDSLWWATRMQDNGLTDAQKKVITDLLAIWKG